MHEQKNHKGPESIVWSETYYEIEMVLINKLTSNDLTLWGFFPHTFPINHKRVNTS